MNHHYSILIHWSDQDQCFVVSLPEWGNLCHTYGETYEQALKNALEVIDFLVQSALEEGESLPRAKTFEQYRESFMVKESKPEESAVNSDLASLPKAKGEERIEN
jgi:antitoxin HicB